MKALELSGGAGKGKFVLLDDDDYDVLSQHKWYLNTAGYAMRCVHISGSHSKNNIVQKNISMSRLLMNLEPGVGVVDHIDGNRLNNQRSNLRVVTYKENSWNSKTCAQSGFLGVVKDTLNCWAASCDGKNLGYYKTDRLAALAVDQYCRTHRGEYAKLNFPEITDYSEVVPNPPRHNTPRTSSVRGVSLSLRRVGKTKPWRVVTKKTHRGWFWTEAEAIEFLENYESTVKSADPIG